MKKLIEDGYIEPCSFKLNHPSESYYELVPTLYELSIKGIDALEEVEKRHEEETEYRAKKALDKAEADNKILAEHAFIVRNNIITVIATVVASSATTLLIEHFTDVVSFLKWLVHSIFW